MTVGHDYTAYPSKSAGHYVGHSPSGGANTFTGYLGSPYTPVARSHTVVDRSDYRLSLGVKSYDSCTGIEASMKLWFAWDA